MIDLDKLLDMGGVTMGKLNIAIHIKELYEAWLSQYDGSMADGCQGTTQEIMEIGGEDFAKYLILNWGRSQR